MKQKGRANGAKCSNTLRRKSLHGKKKRDKRKRRKDWRVTESRAKKNKTKILRSVDKV